MRSDEWLALRRDLATAGVSGVEDLGRFVSNVEMLRPSSFDEKAAMPVLIDALPNLSDPALVNAVAGHLRRPWARPSAFGALLEAFRRWAPINTSTAWHLGDALGSAATLEHLDDLLVVCQDATNGTARQMAVDSLGRFKKSPLIAPALLELIYDDDVGLHAMSALRRALGAAGALEYIEAVEHQRSGTKLGEQAARQAKKIRRSLGM